MRLNPHVARASVLALALALTPALQAATQTPAASGPNASTSAALANIRIDNFGQIDEHYYRGAQPEGRDYADLKALGVKTVIDLTKGGRDDEAGFVQQNGMTFYRIPMTTSDRPADAAVAQFLKLVTDPANQPVYVHCQGGRHRTGAMTAVYRMNVDKWDATKAYGEMKQFKFEGFPGHPELKQFVYDYFTQLSAASAPASIK
jgi:protein tyrosine/serine phosphatase